MAEGQGVRTMRVELKHLRNEVKRLRQRIRRLGEMADVCVYGDVATGELCSGCRCPRRIAPPPPPASPAAGG